MTMTLHTAAQALMKALERPVEFMVGAMEANGVRGLGRRCFRSAPQVGHYIMIVEEEGEQAYEVVAVLHPDDPEIANAAGDLLVRHIGGGDDLRWRIRQLAVSDKVAS